MTQTKSLAELGKDYLHEAEVIEDKIKNCRSRLKNESSDLKNEEILRLRSLLRILYDQKNELTLTGKFLTEYYIKPERRHYG